MTSCPLLVFADDWGRHPSSCQHLIGRLLPQHPVLWVNTIGTRRPRLNLATFRRAGEKLRHWLRPAADRMELPEGLRVCNPHMWPSFGSALARGLNRRLLRRQLRPLLRGLASPAVAITTLPLVADLIPDLPVRHWVYYCVDDFSEWPGLDGATMRIMEQHLIDQVEALIAVSTTLRDRLEKLAGRPVHLLTHGVDLDFWAPSKEAAPLPQLAGLPRPLVVFWGLLDRRMDVDLVLHLAGQLPQGTVVLAGPHNDPDPRLLRGGRVAAIGPLPYDSLPALAGAAAVLLMPYADLPVTRAMQPLKLKEYLATGLPVVARDLPANREWADCLDLAGNGEDFTRAVLLRIETGLPREQLQARERLVEESWTAKASQLERLLLANVPARRV